MSTKRYTARQARPNFRELLELVRYQKTPVIITRYKEDAVMVLPCGSTLAAICGLGEHEDLISLAISEEKGLPATSDEVQEVKDILGKLKGS